MGLLHEVSGTVFVFQRLRLPTAILTSPHAVQRRIKGMDVFYVSSLLSGVWAVYRKPPEAQFSFKHVYPLPTRRGTEAPTSGSPGRQDDLRHGCALGDTIHVLRIADDPLNPVLLQEVPAPNIHVVKFSTDGKRWTARTASRASSTSSSRSRLSASTTAYEPGTSGRTGRSRRHPSSSTPGRAGARPEQWGLLRGLRPAGKPGNGPLTRTEVVC